MTPLSRVTVAGITLGLAALAGSCRKATRLSLEAGSTMTSLRFELSDDGGAVSIGAFRVDRCNARGSPTPESHWLTLAPDTAETIARLTYGAPPPGWRSVQGPQPMVAGCYRAAIANAAPLEFEVLPDGQVKARRER